MKNSKSLFRIVPALMLLLFISFSCKETEPVPSQSNQEYYEIKIYSIADNSQESMVDAYLKDAYLPALHRAGITAAGVFKPVETDTSYGKLIYVFIPFKTIDLFMQLPEVLLKDKVYTEAGKFFVDAVFDIPPYNRQESILLKAFKDMPQFAVPEFTTPVEERIYELRSYESATEAKALKKIEMFNEGGESALFKSLKFNPVFFGEVLIGDQMPNLMYLTTFSDMQSHDDHWNSFRDSPEWKELSGLEEYKNTVSKAHVHLLHPTSYSDF